MKAQRQLESKGSFTRTPWKLREPDQWERSRAEVVTIVEDRVIVIADCGFKGSGEANGLAENNARLIAAAPTLYDAAMSALVYLQTQDMSERGKSVAQGLIDALALAAD